jgi:hexokinase
MNTRISENMLTKAEYDQRHKSLETKIDTDLKFVNQRLTAMDEDRTAIKLSVTTLMARAGYISAGFVMGALGLLIALSNVLLDFIHPAVSVLSGVKP